MKVAKLIELLQQYDLDADVVCQWWEGQGDAFTPEVVELDGRMYLNEQGQVKFNLRETEAPTTVLITTR